MELRIDAQARGTRIVAGQDAKERRQLLNSLIALSEANGFEEISLPSVEPEEIYIDKAGAEVLGQMYVFPDRKGRKLCLRPEGTATIQLIADKHFKRLRNVKLWYFEKCWRYERPQEGRYREFFQFGVEILNPSEITARAQLLDLAEQMVSLRTSRYEVHDSVKRGLAYYTADGFEIRAPELGAQQQILGGGGYRQGVGFGIGFDRLMLCAQATEQVVSGLG